MTVIPDGFGEAAWQFLASGDPDPWFVTIGVAFEDPFDPEDWLSAMADTWGAHLRDVSLSDMALVLTKISYNDGGSMLEAEHPVGLLGTGGTTKLPQNCACLVRKNTGLVGRHFKGRMYWPGILSEADVSPVGRIDSSVVTAYQALFNSVYGDLNAVTNAQPALLHTDATAPTFVTSFSVQQTIATQRRRLR